MEEKTILPNNDSKKPFLKGPINIDTYKDKALWDKLIQEIINGNVIPVIGADLLIDWSTDLHKRILDLISEHLGIGKNFNSFSELVYDKRYKNEFSKDVIYLYVFEVLNQLELSPSQRLRKLLSTKQFPFVITTSFSPLVEETMREIWGEELKVMKFCNNKSINDDIIDKNSLRIPTVYYMLGKVCNEVNSYVLTDTDLMDYVSSWNNPEAQPRILCDALKDKYLLMLGNTYSDWLFRFIWYSIRNKETQANGMFAYDDNNLDQSLINFLERKDTFTKQDTHFVIDQIVERLDKKLKEIYEYKFRRPEENTDIFISYSRRDKDLAEQLYNALTSQGLRVWYDKNDITTGDRFMDEIKKAIRKTRYFIPLFTSNIELEKKESHVYRNEWHTAIEVARSMGRRFIIPVANKNFDFYNAQIPEEITNINATFYSDNDCMENVAKEIIHTINQD